MSRVGELFSRRFALGAVVLIVAGGLLGGFLWLRDSSLVRVEHVKITGLTTRDAPAIRRTLRQAATRMTTLHYDARALERAVDAFPAVQSVSVAADLPKTLEIRVREHRPVAALQTGDGRRVAVASDGTLLPRSRRGSLPSVKVDSSPGGPGSVGRRWKSASYSCWRVPPRSCGRSSTAPTAPRTEFGSRCGPARRCGSARHAGWRRSGPR